MYYIIIGYLLVPKKHDSHIGHKKNSESWDDGYNEHPSTEMIRGLGVHSH